MNQNKDIEKLFNFINDLYKANTKLQKELDLHAKYMSEVEDRVSSLEISKRDMTFEFEVLKRLIFEALPINTSRYLAIRSKLAKELEEPPFDNTRV